MSATQKKLTNAVINLYPAILTNSDQEFATELAKVQASQVIEIVQIDVIDGCFADNLTLGPLDITQVDYGDLQIDVHLMVEEPIDFVHEMVAVKDYLPIRAVIAQIERMSHQDDYLQTVFSQGWQAGLSLDLHTPVSAIDKNSWQYLDIVQIMTIETGFQGQQFHSQALDKVSLLRSRAQKKIEIIVDGGVKRDQIKLLQKYQVDSVVVGSGLWDPQETIKAYFQLMQYHTELFK